MLKLEDRPEVFRFFQLSFDVNLIRRHIELGTVQCGTQPVDVTKWATSLMGLDRSKPDEEVVAFMIGIDYAHVRSISEERMMEPLILVETDMGAIFVDGSHRIAKAYLKGINTLPAYYIRKHQIAAMQKPIKPMRLKVTKASWFPVLEG